jgi:hypothetical protein
MKNCEGVASTFAAATATQAPTHTRTWVVKIPRRARQALNAVGQCSDKKIGVIRVISGQWTTELIVDRQLPMVGYVPSYQNTS